MKLIKTIFEDAYLVEMKINKDHRGFFMESYNEKLFIEHGLSFNFIQDNHSLSVESGTIRGLHYQLEPYAQTKFIRVTQGVAFDVIVDIREGSPTYGKWQSFILTADNRRQLLFPKGFAHGYCTLVENTEVQYKVDNYYSPDHDCGIRWNDPDLNISWPVRDPILSEKDKRHPLFKEIVGQFKYGIKE